MYLHLNGHVINELCRTSGLYLFYTNSSLDAISLINSLLIEWTMKNPQWVSGHGRPLLL